MQQLTNLEAPVTGNDPPPAPAPAVVVAERPAVVWPITGGRRAEAPTVSVWPARPAHLDALGRLLERSSDETLYRRFHGIAGPAARREMARVANPTAGHRSWVACDGDEIRGTITLATSRDGRHEIGILVEDAWFRRGVGRLLVKALVLDARSRGVDELVADVQSDNHRAREFFLSLAPDARTSFEDGSVVVRIPLASAVEPPAEAFRPTVALRPTAPVLRAG